MSITTTAPKARAARKSASTTTAVHLPTNLVLAIQESLEALEDSDTVADFLVGSTRNIFDDNSGFFESYIDDDSQPRHKIEAKLARIRRKYGYSKAKTAISDDEPDFRPILFPAESVKLLEALLEVSGTGLKPSDYAREFLSSEITDSLNGVRNGVISALAGAYQLEPEDFSNMQAMVDYWNSKKTITA